MAEEHKALQNVKVIAFDMYGTLVNPAALSDAVKQFVPERVDAAAFNQLWRVKQLEYTWIRALMGKYCHFYDVSRDALKHCIEQFECQGDISDEQVEELLSNWRKPTAFPEMIEVLPQIKDKFRICVLSNGNPEMLQAGLTHTQLLPNFEKVISVDEVKTFKPNPQVYELVCKHFGVPKEQIMLVSSNSFDACGARKFGFEVCWIHRQGSAPAEALGETPSVTVSSLGELAALLREVS